MSFEASRRFTDTKHFPRGIRRSCQFTITEADILEKQGDALKALFEKTRQPADAIEQQFVEVCDGLREASTAVEKAWIKYLKQTQRKRFHTLCQTSKNGSSDDDNTPSSSEDLDEAV